VLALSALASVALAACGDDTTTAPVTARTPSLAVAGSATTGAFQFTPVATSAACTAGGNAECAVSIPAGYTQANIASEPDYMGNPDMITQNETGPEGRPLHLSRHTSSASTRTPA
jgi:hypothetical protein